MDLQQECIEDFCERIHKQYRRFITDEEFHYKIDEDCDRARDENMLEDLRGLGDTSDDWDRGSY